MKVTYPPLAEGQTGWNLYGSTPVYETPPDNRNLYQRAMYWTLMWLHDHAETLWHWCYYTAQRYRKPDAVHVRDDYHLITTTSDELGA